jgi:hypothetical protein
MVSRPGVEEPEGEEDVRGRRGCHGEPRRGRMRWRGMARLGFCRGSAEPRCKKRTARKTMKNAEPKSKPHHQTKLLNGFCMALCIEAVERSGINAPAILFECELKPGDGGCVGHEPSTWLRAPLASPFTHIWPSGPQYHPIRGRIDCSCFTNALLKSRMLRFLR